MDLENKSDYIKGRGAQINIHNPFQKNEYTSEHIEGIDEQLQINPNTQFFYEEPRKIINDVTSPDLGFMYSMNPYQGCEHGCIYCYARNTHQYWGFSAGNDFESKIIVKKNVPELLKKQLKNTKWEPSPIMLSGNTDCYQPIERKLGITRKVLETLLKYRHPVSIITKNSLLLRDMDILCELNKYDLVHVSITITSLDEELRLKLEPRTSTYKNRLDLVKKLSDKDIPVNVMMAPIIPSINSHEIPQVLKAISENGASTAAYTIVRLNGAILEIFKDWLLKNFPDRSEKVLNQIADCHGGKLNDSSFGKRFKGEGQVAESIAKLFMVSKNKYFKGRRMKSFNLSHFHNRRKGQLGLFN